MAFAGVAETDPSKNHAVVIQDVNNDARIQLEAEHDLTFRKAVSLYPTAVFWSLFFSLGIIM